MGVTDSVSCRVAGRLGERASPFGLARGRGLPFPVARPAHGFLFHHRHSGTIEWAIQNGNRSSHHHRQVQRHGPLILCLRARGDIFPAGLGRALHGLAGHFQIGPKFPFLASAIEGASGPTPAGMRRTPGENSVFSISRSTSAGNGPRWQCTHRE